MKKVLILFFATTIFANYSFSQDVKNCKILTEIFDNCVNNIEIQSCRDRGIALYYSLNKANIDDITSKKILKLCVFYCNNKALWDKQFFEKACFNGFKEFIGE